MIVVLTLGRSGSSLIMQSLHRLGVTIVGRRFDSKPTPELQALHESLNPGGFYEQPEIYYGGPASDQFQALAGMGMPASACKMDVRHFVSETQRQCWKHAADAISCVLVSYREPSEQAHSEFTSSATPLPNDDPAHRFVFISQFLRNYTTAYGGTNALLESELRALKRKTHFINRASALAPADYVERLCRFANLSPAQQQIRSAIANIDPKLFRVKLSDIDRMERNWATKLGAADVYAELDKCADLCSRAQQTERP